MTLLARAEAMDRASRELVHLDIEADLDLGDLTLEVQVGDGDFDTWTWTGDATTTGAGTEQRWQRTGRRMVAGPEAPAPGAALVLAVGLNPVRWRLTGSSEAPVRRADPIEVA